MKIQLKKQLHENLLRFQEQKNDPDPNCFYFHPDYHITYDDRNTVFDVKTIVIQWIEESFICFQESPDRFDFFSRKYFDIVDFSIPKIWWIWGFPKWHLCFWRDAINETTLYNYIIDSSEKIYYWGYPLFYSDIYFLNNYYDNRALYTRTLEDYKKLDTDDNMILVSQEYIDEVLELIHKLP